MFGNLFFCIRLEGTLLAMFFVDYDVGLQSLLTFKHLFANIAAGGLLDRFWYCLTAWICSGVSFGLVPSKDFFIAWTCFHNSHPFSGIRIVHCFLELIF